MLKATFAAGCFWGPEKKFRAMNGVSEAFVGYTGGTVDNPTYEQVCGKQTGHLEAVEVQYDPNVVTYGQLLDAFWTMHNPTQSNGQGPDIGPQYMSAIFFHNEEQRQEAEASKAALQAKLPQPIATLILQAPTFWMAEDYHQNYLNKRGGGWCH